MGASLVRGPYCQLDVGLCDVAAGARGRPQGKPRSLKAVEIMAKKGPVFEP